MNPRNAIGALGVLCGLAAAPLPVEAAKIEATVAHVVFHISHPAKEYDARLLPGGATIHIEVDPTDMAATQVRSKIEVEYFNSDNERRDSHMMETLEGLIFPTIDWTVAGLSDVSGPWKTGSFEVRAKGPLTLHGETRDLEIPVTIEVAENGLIDAKARFTIALEDYGIERPSLVFVPIANDVPIEVQFVFPAGKSLFAPTVASDSNPQEEGAENKKTPENTEEKKNEEPLPANDPEKDSGPKDGSP